MLLPTLRLPESSNSRQPKPFAKPRQIRAWIEKLPTANSLAAANQLLLQLRAINSAGYNCKQRFEMLQELQPLCKQLSAELRHSLKNAAIPLSRNQLQTAQLQQQLLQEQTTGYKIIINEIALQNGNKKNSSWILQESIYLAIKYMARQLVLVYALYQPEPENLWHELHQLYRFADGRGLHTEAIDDTDPDTPLPIEQTIDYAYKRIVLLRLTEPYHLLESEAENTYQLVALWANGCEFHSLGSAPPQGEYIIDQATDLPPRYIPQDVEYQPQQGLLIDISETRDQLEKHLQHILRLNMQDIALDGSTLVDRRERDMLLRLGDALNGRLVRRSKRFPLEGKIQLSLGLNACHYQISQRAGFTPQMDELKLRSYTDEKLHPEQTPVPFATAYREALEKDRPHTQQSFTMNPWWQRNVSPLGIALSCSEHCAPMHAKVGQITAYRHGQKQNSRWQLGVVRWLRTQPSLEGDGALELGIMNLANGAVPVGIKAVSGAGAGTDYYRGLLIPRQVSLAQSRSLIAPALLFDINTVMAVNMKERMFYIRLSNMLLTTLDFAQFEFEIMQQPPDILF